MEGGDDTDSLAIGDHGKVQPEVDGGGIEDEQLVLEAKPLLFTRSPVAEEVSQMKEGILIKLPGTVGTGV